MNRSRFNAPAFCHCLPEHGIQGKGMDAHPRHISMDRGMGSEQIRDARQLKQPAMLLKEDLLAHGEPPGLAIY